MADRRNIVLAIALVATFLLPSSAPAADNFTVELGDITVGVSRISASQKNVPGLGATIFLQPCSASITTDCIQTVSYQRKNSSNWVTLTPDEKVVFPAAGVPSSVTILGTAPETLTPFAADISNNLPAGGMTPLYKNSSAINDDGVRYLVVARASGSPDAVGKVTWRSLQFDIKPVTVVDYSVLDQFGFPVLKPLSTFQNVEAFQVDLRSKATRNLFTGWFYGRILQPEIKSTSVSDEETIVRISGAPITTHVAQGKTTYDQYAALQASTASGLPRVGPTSPKIFLGATYGFANGAGAMKAWRLLSPLMNQRAVTSASAFTLSTTKNSSLLTDYYPQGCQASESTDGVVTTNATMYNPAPPIYDAKDSSLNFEVGSPHLDSVGQVIQGFYSLVVSAKIAKCIWGSDLTGSKATVRIINDAGQTQVSTSVLKVLNGFYYFHISGFTYSTKKISIRLAPTSTATPTPVATPVVKKITCTNGKLKKIISGVKPVCPKGYKIK